MALYIGNGKKVSVKVVKDNGIKAEGTAIPRGKIVKKIYFNTNNTAKETFDILNQLTYMQTPLVSYPINVIYGNTADGVTGTVIYAIKYSDTEIAIQELQDLSNLNKFHIFYNSDNTNLRSAGFNGWNFTTRLDINPTTTTRNEEIGIHSVNIYSEGQALTDFNGIPIGAENEKIKNILSTTPFAIASAKIDVEGVAIPVEKDIERIYFNTNNTPEETDKLLSRLTYIEGVFENPTAFIYADTDDGNTGNFIGAWKYDDTHYGIGLINNLSSMNGVILYATPGYLTEDDSYFYNGWAKSYGFIFAGGTYDLAVGSIGLPGSSISEFMGFPVGTENELIKNVLSITPFAAVSPKEVLEGTSVSSGFVERVYFNVNNSKKETNTLLSQLPYVQTPLLQHPIYPIFAYADPNGNGHTGKFIFVVKNGNNYEINYSDDLISQHFVYLYATGVTHTFNGWSYCDTIGSATAEGVPAFIELNETGLSEWNGMPVGAENEKIKNVLSITPFTVKGDDRYDEGVEAGKQAEYDAFWDAYQQNGTRTDYRSAFGGIGWDDKNFIPKYDMQPSGAANNMFSQCNILDLPAALEKAGVVLDFSKANNMQQVFMDSKIKHIGVVDISNCVYVTYLFHCATSLETVDRVVFSEKVINIDSGFAGCTALKNISFDGTIATNISFSDSPLLTNDSVQSIIDHLKDLTGATAQTLTFHATVGGNMTAEQKAAITAKNWQLVY